MIEIFYLFSMFFVVKELEWVFNPKKETLRMENIKENISKIKNKLNGPLGYDELNDIDEKLLKNIGTTLIVLIWVIFGLFTFNGLAFLIYLLFNILIIIPISKIFKYNNIYTITHWFNSILGLLFWIYIILNEYIFRINLKEMLINLY